MISDIKKDRRASGVADADVVQPFSLEQSNVRGRMVRLDSVLAEIMSRHEYPRSVATLLSELVLLSVMLSAMLKYDGVFSLQIKGDGPISSLVADVTSNGDVRAYAGFDADALGELSGYGLLGHGHLLFTVKSEVENSQNYQGIVGMQGKSIADDVAHYFTQSEQIKTSFKIALHPQDGYAKAGGIMIQQLPYDPKAMVDAEKVSEDWNRASVMLASCTDEEILSATLSSMDILYRLFNEDGVVVYPLKHLHFKCSCSMDKINHVIASLPRKDMDEICEKDGRISVVCEFCNEEYIVNHDDLDNIFAQNKKEKESAEDI